MNGHFLQFFSIVVFALPLAAATETSFEKVALGPVATTAFEFGTLVAAEGHAEILRGHARTGERALLITGGDDRECEWRFERPLAQSSRLTFWAERWTRRDPFAFSVDIRDGEGWREAARADGVKVGGYHEKVEIALPVGTRALRFRCSSAAGVLLDDFTVAADTPMKIGSVQVLAPTVPAFPRADFNPVLGLVVETQGALEPLSLGSVIVAPGDAGWDKRVRSLEVRAGGESPSGEFGPTLSVADPNSGECTLVPTGAVLAPGKNVFWIGINLNDGPATDDPIELRVRAVRAGGKEFQPDPVTARVLVGALVRKPGDDGSKSFRIPGLARTQKGSLLAVYDVRYNHAGDLPANIDVGVSRSTDGGWTWEPMRIAIDMGNEPRFSHDGVGDPAILVDEKTGRIWVAALWSHGNRAWNGSGPGLTPEETGQLVLVHSDDDGVTWSKPRNITREVKDPAWRLLLNGPGAGITMRDGTLVFAAQFRAADGGETKGKPFSTILWSKDRGETWKIGTGAKIDTTEAQVVELSDGSLMLNCRDNRGGSRTVMITRDLGKTWIPHPTDRKGLIEPVCMASLLAWNHPVYGRLLLFSNPASTRGRENMTLKISRDEGMTWPETYHFPYDVRSCFGYSCLAPVDDHHAGVFYEGRGEMYFLRLPLGEILRRP